MAATDLIPTPPPNITADVILSGLHFTNAFWAGRTITYSIPSPGAGSSWSTASYGTGSEPFRAGYGVLSSTQASAFRSAMAAWDKLILPTFVELSDAISPGDIRVAFTAVTDTSSWGYATPAPTNGRVLTARQGDIWIDDSHRSSLFTPLSFDFSSLLHEIGHALGLKHSFESPAIPFQYENDTYTVMSYSHFDNSLVTFSQSSNTLRPVFTEVNPSTPMVLDIYAIQTVYGPDPTTATGDDTYSFSDTSPFRFSIYDAGGIDTFDLTRVTRDSIVDLRPGAYSSIGIYTMEQQIADQQRLYPNFSPTFIASMYDSRFAYTYSENVGIAFFTIIENINGGRGNDLMIGNDYINFIYGGAGNDKIIGGGGSGGMAAFATAGDYLSGDDGDDILQGDGGDDTLVGGANFDTALYLSVSTNYSWTKDLGGVWTVRDLRAGSPDGTDILFSMERLSFTDRNAALVPALSAPINTAFQNITRASPDSTQNSNLALSLTDKFAVGATNTTLAVGEIVRAAGATTSVATLAYEFFTGKIPSAAGLDYLVSPTGPNLNNLNSAYYQSFSLENRYINFAVNLGKLGEGATRFASTYASKTLFEATRTAYSTIFGSSPTDAKLHALLDPAFVLNGVTMTRSDYFGLYGQDGPNGIGTKAAMVGWLLGEAVKADIGTYAKVNDAYLADLADGASYAIDIVGVYNRPEYAYTGG